MPSSTHRLGDTAIVTLAWQYTGGMDRGAFRFRYWFSEYRTQLSVLAVLALLAGFVYLYSERDVLLSDQEAKLPLTHEEKMDIVATLGSDGDLVSNNEKAQVLENLDGESPLSRAEKLQHLEALND